MGFADTVLQMGTYHADAVITGNQMNRWIFLFEDCNLCCHMCNKGIAVTLAGKKGNAKPVMRPQIKA